MARAYQRLTVRKIKKKGEEPGSRPVFKVFAVRKTGYYNLWINGKHYYYDRREEVNNIKQVDMHNYFIGAEKKGTIVVRRK